MTRIIALVAAAFLVACTPARLLLRPDGALPEGRAWLAGHLAVDGLETVTWDDPLTNPYGQAFLLAELHSPEGERLLVPCRPDGTFLCQLPPGTVTVRGLIVATPHGLLANVTAEPPLELELTAGATDLGGLAWQVHPAQRGAWQQALAARDGMRRLSVRAQASYRSDDRAGRILDGALGGAVTVTVAPGARRARLAAALDDLARRLGL